MDASPASIQPAQLNSSHPPSSANHQSQSTSSTGPQIRSRITVVCAECKRLKLKCDRRAPCGSCTKRDTVVRCIYSPAAAEKVDLHSLNNRLIQVEATLAMITSGQVPPAFQSTYPFSMPPSNPPSSSALPHHQGSHQHHHHYAAPSHRTPGQDAIAISHQDLASIWLEDLDLGVAWPSSSSHIPTSSASTSLRQPTLTNAGNSGFIKLESSPLDLELVRSNDNPEDPYASFPHSGNGSTNSALPSRSSSPLKRSSPLRTQQQRFLQEQRSSAQLLLPALSIYFPVPAIQAPGTSASSSAAFPHRPSTGSSSSASPTTPSGSSGYSFPPQPQYTKPQVTPALLALLPPLSTCTRFLQSAMEVFRVRPLPFEPGNGNGWKAFERKCMILLGGGTKKDKERKEREREKAREAKRARQIYFGGVTGLPQQQQDTEMDEGSGVEGNGNRGCSDNGGEGGSGDGHSLSFFAMMCVVLAVGASVSAPATSGMATTETPAFFHALAQQALGVWDTHISSSGSVGTDETEKMHYLFACLVGVIYLLHSGTEVADGREDAARDEGSGLIYALVGKMVNAARAMGLGREGPTSRSAKLERRASVSSPFNNFSTSSQIENSAEREISREEWRKMVWWEVVFYDLFTADALGHQPHISAYSFTTQLPACAGSVPSDSGFGEFDSEDEDAELGHTADPQTGYYRHDPRHANGPVLGREDSYFGARYRLTQLAQTIKNRISHPDCCCGYTLDQAASLEGDIRRWQGGLPISLKGPSDEAGHIPTVHWSENLAVDKTAQLQSYELAMMANLLVLKVYTPFLRPPSLAHHSSNDASPVANSPASQSSVHAAQSIVRMAKALQSSLSTTSKNILPAMFDFYPLDKLVFDSVIVCAHAAFSNKASTLLFDCGALVDDVGSGLNVLSGLPSSSTGALADAQRQVADALSKRIVSRPMHPSLKRKHDQVDVNVYGDSTPGYGSSSNGAAGGSNGEDIMPGFDFDDLNNSQMSQYLHNGLPAAQQQHSRLVDLSSSASPTAPSAPPSFNPAAQQSPTRNSEKDKASNDKDKKGTKKQSSYPPVGIRVRAGKDLRGLASGMLAPPPLMTSTPRPLPSADVVLAYQQQHKQKFSNQAQTSTMGPIGGTSQISHPPSSPVISKVHQQDAYRSRSSSLSHGQQQHHQHQMEYPMPFAQSQASENVDMQQRKRFAMQDNRQQQEISPQPPFAPPDLDQSRQQAMYEQQSQDHFESHLSSVPAMDRLTYNGVSSSPFSSNASGPISSSSSPFATTSNSGHPSTPTFTAHHPNPPVFGPPPPPPVSVQPPQPTPGSPVAFFHGQNAYNGSYTNSPALSSSVIDHRNHGQSISLTEMGMDQAMMTIPSTPVYEKSHHPQQQHAMDSLAEHNHMLQQQHEHQQQHSQQHHAMGSSYDGQDMAHHGQQLTVGMPVGSSWSSSTSEPQPFWNNGADFKFYQ